MSRQTPQHLAAPWWRRLFARGWLIRAALGLVALAVLMTPFVVSFRQAIVSRQVSRQVEVPAAKLSERQHARYSDFRNRVGTNTPIVLSYREIRPSREGQDPHPDVVTPTALASHLAMLQAAGYTTLSAEQLTGYLDGKPVPDRSIALTFDGGLQGTWTFVDGLLRRYRFRGMAFIPTARIGTRTSSRYLTWSELQRMHTSGRWDIQSQGPDPDATVRLTADGQSAGFYSARAWLPDKRRRESASELRRRIQQTVSDSVAAFLRHGLPAPRFFGGVPTDPVADQVLTRLFRAEMEDAELPSAVSRRDAAGRRITRLPVQRTTTAGQLFRQLGAMTTFQVTALSPAKDRQRWYIHGRDSGQLRYTADGMTFASSLPGRLEALYAPQATEDWTHYAIALDVTGLSAKHPTTTAGLTILDGSPGECELRVSTATVGLFCPTRGLVHQQALAPRSSHRLEAEVSRRWLVVEVDGTAGYQLQLPTTPPTGGFGVSIYRATGDLPAPRFDRIRLGHLLRRHSRQWSSGPTQAGSGTGEQRSERGT